MIHVHDGPMWQFRFVPVYAQLSEFAAGVFIFTPNDDMRPADPEPRCVDDSLYDVVCDKILAASGGGDADGSSLTSGKRIVWKYNGETGLGVAASVDAALSAPESQRLLASLCQRYLD